MNYLLKRIFVGVCIALVMMLVHRVAHAVPPTTQTYYVSGYSTKRFATGAGACSAGVVAQFSTYTGIYTVVSGAGHCEIIRNTGVDSGNWFVVNTVTAAVCYDLSDPVSGSCAAAPVPTTCVPDGIGSDPLPGSHSDMLYAGRGKTQGWPKKVNGCGIQIDQLEGECKSYATGTAGIYDWYCPMGYHYDGTGTYAPDSPGPTAPVPVVPTTTPAETNQPMVAPSPNPDNSCPAGTQNVGTDSTGLAMCKGNGTGTSPTSQNTATAPPVTKSNADGSTTTTNSSTASNADGSTTTNTTACTVATNGGQTCTTSSNTGTNSAGAPGKSDGTGAGGGGSAGDDLCKNHPELNTCSNSSVTGNNCSGGVSQIAWSGDAIQGTILKRVADEQCSEQVVTPAGTLGNQLMTGGDPMQGQINTAMTGTTVDLSSNSLDQSGFLGGGAGFVDQTVAVGKGSMTLPFSKITNNAAPLRYAVLLVALIVAFMLVSKSIIQGA